MYKFLIVTLKKIYEKFQISNVSVNILNISLLGSNVKEIFFLFQYICMQCQTGSKISTEKTYKRAQAKGLT